MAVVLLTFASCSSAVSPRSAFLNQPGIETNESPHIAQEENHASSSPTPIPPTLYHQMLQQGNYSDAAIFQSLQEFKLQPASPDPLIEHSEKPITQVALPDPGFSGTTTESTLGADWHTKVGWTLVLDGNYPAAEAAYRQALRHETTSAEAYLGLGMALMFQGKREQAILAYEEALKIHPSYAAALVHLGYAYADSATEEPDSRAKARLLFQQASDLGDPFALLALMGMKEKEEGI